LSRIYEALKLLNRERPVAARRPRQMHADERRRSERRFRRVPVFVYGHSEQGAPFHEETHMTCVNAGGGLAALASPVAPGQKLILVHLGTQAEQACRVVRVQNGGERASVALAFPSAHSDFWD
jgi:hypothetical protein